MRPPSERRISPFARLFGATASGLVEILIFHPFDTIGKRLMTNEKTIFSRSYKATLKRFRQVVFAEAWNKSFWFRIQSLFDGIAFAAAYKVTQRAYRFGGQPIVADIVERKYGDWFYDNFGRKYFKPTIHALTGTLIGLGEVAIVPFDVLKIKRQTNPKALKGRTVWEIVETERFRLYNGSSWAMLRNGPGSFALFGGAALTKDWLFELEDYNDATLFQTFVSSVVGSLLCIMIANPLDVIKTRVQGKEFESTKTGTQILKDLIKREGVVAFYKGLTPKIFIVGPKLMFSFTAAQTFIQYMDTLFPVETKV